MKTRISSLPVSYKLRGHKRIQNHYTSCSSLYYYFSVNAITCTIFTFKHNM